MTKVETKQSNSSLTGDVSDSERQLLSSVGYNDEQQRAATSVLVDYAVRRSISNDTNVVILPLKIALQEYDFVQDLMFGLVDPNENEHISQVAEHMHDPLGHFIWVREGAKVKLPIQCFTLLEKPQGRQFTHDITLIDKNAEVELILGSTVPANVHAGKHISVSETYIRAGAKYTSVSMEHWGHNMEVYSYGYEKLEQGSHSISTSISLSPIRQHVSKSTSTLMADAILNEQSIMFAPKGTTRIVDTETHLIEEGAQAESISRMVTNGGSITNNALLIGDAPKTNGFLGCDGLKLGADGKILAVPSLLAKAENAQLSHEASVGMVSSEKLAYLMAAGMSEDAARDLIVQGFLSLNSENIPQSIRVRVEEMIASAKSGGM